LGFVLEGEASCATMPVTRPVDAFAALANVRFIMSDAAASTHASALAPRARCQQPRKSARTMPVTNLPSSDSLHLHDFDGAPE